MISVYCVTTELRKIVMPQVGVNYMQRSTTI